MFAKFASAWSAPVRRHHGRRADRGVDFEAELAVVTGRGLATRRRGGMAAVARLHRANDVSARDLQFADGQWMRAKSLDTFCPIGPFLVFPGPDR